MPSPGAANISIACRSIPIPLKGMLTREQYLDYISRVEDRLGLTDQPRAIIFHVKNGREHCHVAWSRVDAENGKAVHIAFDREKLMMVTREFARHHDLRLPVGYDRDAHDHHRHDQLSLIDLQAAFAHAAAEGREEKGGDTGDTDSQTPTFKSVFKSRGRTYKPPGKDKDTDLDR